MDQLSEWDSCPPRYEASNLIDAIEQFRSRAFNNELPTLKNIGPVRHRECLPSELLNEQDLPGLQPLQDSNKMHR